MDTGERASEPDALSSNSSKKDAENYIKAILDQDLPENERKSLATDLNWSFVLQKHSSWTKKIKLPKKKKQFLTRNERKSLNLLHVPKEGWCYSKLEPMRQMWRAYMRKNIDAIQKAPGCEDPTWTNFSALLAKSEFIGAEMCVARSNVPSTVGMKGTVVYDSKCAFYVVTPKSELKVLLKKPSVFTVNLDNLLFTIFGKHMMIRPSERSVKKIKLLMVPDL